MKNVKKALLEPMSSQPDFAIELKGLWQMTFPENSNLGHVWSRLVTFGHVWSRLVILRFTQMPVTGKIR